MPTIAILPSRLIVTSIVNSMDFLGLTNLADKFLSEFGKAYFNRGIAKYNLKDIPGGLEDFQKSAELFKAQDKIEDDHKAVAKITEVW